MPRMSAKPVEPPTVNINIPSAPAQEAAQVEPEEKSPTWFWEKINSIPKDDWGRLYNLLLMRQGSSKVPMADGYKGYLETFFAPVTLAEIKQKYGGGKYRMILEKNSRFVTSHDFDIEGAPLYDLTRERPSASPSAAAATDAKLLNILESQISRLNEQLAASQAAGKQNPALDQAITILSTAYKEGLAAIGSNVTGGGSILDTIKMLKELGLVGGSSQNDVLMGALLKPLIEKLITPIDPMSQMTQFLTIFEKLDALRGSGGDSKARDWKAMAVEGLIQKGPEILREIRETQQIGAEAAKERRATAEINARTAQMIRSVAPSSAASNGVSGAAAEPPQPGPVANGPIQVTPLEASSAPAVAEQEMARMSDTGTFPPQPHPSAEVKLAEDAIAGWIKGRIVQLVQEGEEPERIIDFLDIADPSVSDLLVKYSEDAVSTFLAGDPILKLAVDHANWKNFLARARAYIQEGEKLETATPN